MRTEHTKHKTFTVIIFKSIYTKYQQQSAYISNTDGVQCGQLVDGQAVGVVSSGGQQRPGGVQFNRVDPAALLVYPRACRGEVVPPCCHSTHHPRVHILALPVLQHRNACDLSRQNIGHKELQVKKGRTFG